MDASEQELSAVPTYSRMRSGWPGVGASLLKASINLMKGKLRSSATVTTEGSPLVGPPGTMRRSYLQRLAMS